ncbi:MAG: hypothetical protein JNK82_04240 [Myxococcaceae bacterium]|nr:hypothetical protein [Myxococcaceae bacterium]
MATWAQVARIMSGIATAVRAPGKREWRVAKKLAVWERPLRKSDLEALGEAAPKGDVLGVYVPLEVKEQLLKTKKRYCFTTPHFDGYPYVLVHLQRAPVTALRSLLVSGCDSRGAKR